MPAKCGTPRGEGGYLCKILKLKEMKKIKINQIVNQKLSEKALNNLKGGEAVYCSCGCKYANQGGSSVDANGAANSRSGLRSNDGGCAQWWYDGIVVSPWACDPK